MCAYMHNIHHKLFYFVHFSFLASIVVSLFVSHRVSVIVSDAVSKIANPFPPQRMAGYTSMKG